MLKFFISPFLNKTLPYLLLSQKKKRKIKTYIFINNLYSLKGEFRYEKNFKSIHVAIILLLSVLLPVGYHIAYYIPAIGDFFIARISIENLLTYTGMIITLFKVYLTIRNNRKDSRICKLRDAMADYIVRLSPYFTVILSKEKNPEILFQSLNNFIDDENRKYQILNLYLSDKHKKQLTKELNTYRVEMMKQLTQITNQLIYEKESNCFSFTQNPNILETANNFGTSMALLSKTAEQIFPKILTEYENSIF